MLLLIRVLAVLAICICAHNLVTDSFSLDYVYSTWSLVWNLSLCHISVDLFSGFLPGVHANRPQTCLLDAKFSKECVMKSIHCKTPFTVIQWFDLFCYCEYFNENCYRCVSWMLTVLEDTLEFCFDKKASAVRVRSGRVVHCLKQSSSLSVLLLDEIGVV